MEKLFLQKQLRAENVQVNSKQPVKCLVFPRSLFWKRHGFLRFVFNVTIDAASVFPKSSSRIACTTLLYLAPFFDAILGTLHCFYKLN